MNINRKIMMSGLSIVSALTLLGGTAFAAFTTTATATGNTFSTSTPNLLIDTGGGPGTNVAGFVAGGLVPGSSTAALPFDLTNADTSADGDLDLTLQFSITGGALDPSKLIVSVVCPDVTVTQTAATWAAGALALGTLDNQSLKSCTMQATLDGSATNNEINKALQFDAVFTGTVQTP